MWGCISLVFHSAHCGFCIALIILTEGTRSCHKVCLTHGLGRSILIILVIGRWLCYQCGLVSDHNWLVCIRFLLYLWQCLLLVCRPHLECSHLRLNCLPRQTWMMVNWVMVKSKRGTIWLLILICCNSLTNVLVNDVSSHSLIRARRFRLIV